VDELPTPTYLRNYETVVDAFGYWPSFHDAPLLSFAHSPSASSVDTLIHVYEMTSETDERGYFGSVKNHLIRFHFSGVADLEFHQFDVPNELFYLIFSDPAIFEESRRFTVRLDSVMGGDCFATFSAALGEVISVEPCNGREQSDLTNR
jgi:hypothetical protein